MPCEACLALDPSGLVRSKRDRHEHCAVVVRTTSVSGMAALLHSEQMS